MSRRIIALAVSFVIIISAIFYPLSAYAAMGDGIQYSLDRLEEWFSTGSTEWVLADCLAAQFSANRPQKYYTTPTNSVQDKYGNVTNYYRGGDTTSTKIIDSYNKTFNTIHNTTNNTNNYQANVKLSDFLNSYTTNNNNYTYSADFKSWYYDNTKNEYNFNNFTKNDYTQNNLYYNQDNSRYYISIDNSTDEYYLIDVQYSPTFVTVNYTYNTTNNNYEKPGDVTNVYYYELKDGRNSSTLTASEIAGLDLGYDTANYELVADDPNTLSLQHFDGDYNDSSSYGRTFYSQNRSTSYVDSGAFGKAVSLPNGSAAGVTIPNLSSYNSLSFDFRVYFTDISNLGIYFGDRCIFENIPDSTRIWSSHDIYDDHLQYVPSSSGDILYSKNSGIAYSKHQYSNSSRYYYDFYGNGCTRLVNGAFYTLEELQSIFSYDYEAKYTFSNQLKEGKLRPTRYNSPGYSAESSVHYGWMNYSNAAPVLVKNNSQKRFKAFIQNPGTSVGSRRFVEFQVYHDADWEYSFTPTSKIIADFSYNSYKNQWVSMRITISGGRLYYFVNGDLVGSGSFTKPTADKFYIKSSGTLYLDELRVTTGDLSSTGTYTPPSSPYDTNKVLALPDELAANTLYVQHSIPVTGSRIGGVRPSNPSKGFLYIPLHEDHTAAQPQLYDGSNWVDVTVMVYDGSTTKTALGYTFSPVGSSPDVDVDAKPERPPDKPDPDGCTHEWKETSRKDSTCTLPGSVESTCSKCKKTKTETLPRLGHTWEVKQSTQTTYDEEGNVLTQGFTIYRCSVCGEEYKDTDGTGPPIISNPSTPDTPGDSDDDDGLLKKIGEFLGSILGGLLELVSSVISGILDGLISLCTKTLESLKNLVDLFGSFGEALGVLWTWLPSEVMLVLVTGVTVFVFVALLKLFMK